MKTPSKYEPHIGTKHAEKLQKRMDMALLAALNNYAGWRGLSNR